MIIFTVYVLLPVQCITFFSSESQSSSPLLIQTPLKAAILKLAQQKKVHFIVKQAVIGHCGYEWPLWCLDQVQMYLLSVSDTGRQ